MIRVDKGNVEIQGKKLLVSAEFALAAHTVKEVLGEEEARRLFDQGMMTMDEVEKETEELMKEQGELLKKIIDESIKKIFGAENE